MAKNIIEYPLSEDITEDHLDLIFDLQPPVRKKTPEEIDAQKARGVIAPKPVSFFRRLLNWLKDKLKR